MESIKRGDRISINGNKRAYFFQTEGGIRLEAGVQEMTVIPDTATEEHINQINMAIANGDIITGYIEKSVDVPDTDSGLKDILEMGRNKIDEWLVTLRQDKKIKREEKLKTVEKLAELEKLGKNRRSVLRAAESALSYIGGVSSVIESDKEAVEIKLIPAEKVEEEPLEAK